MKPQHAKAERFSADEPYRAFVYKTYNTWPKPKIVWHRPAKPDPMLAAIERAGAAYERWDAAPDGTLEWELAAKAFHHAQDMLQRLTPTTNAGARALWDHLELTELASLDPHTLALLAPIKRMLCR